MGFQGDLKGHVSGQITLPLAMHERDDSSTWSRQQEECSEISITMKRRPELMKVWEQAKMQPCARLAR
jgi:hypothetical protein